MIFSSPSALLNSSSICYFVMLGFLFLLIILLSVNMAVPSPSTSIAHPSVTKLRGYSRYLRVSWDKFGDIFIKFVFLFVSPCIEIKIYKWFLSFLIKNEGWAWISKPEIVEWLDNKIDRVWIINISFFKQIIC